MIAYEFQPKTPNDLAAQSFFFDIPLAPVELAAPADLNRGVIGIAINGIPLFGAFEAPRDGYRDPLADGLLDFCNGHTAPGGVYHYHARPDCILADPTLPGTVIGYLFDGYEIVVPYTDSGEKVTSSYAQSGPGINAFEDYTYEAGSGDLDRCNGMTGADGVYRYYATDEFPYLPFCYRGDPALQFEPEYSY